MLSVFGIFMLMYSVNEDIVLYFYGRNFWVVIYKGIVKKVIIENYWVLIIFINFIVFDNWFNSDWLIKEKVGYEIKKVELLK